MKHLIIGLGNIGEEYALTRHNIGFLVLDRLADLHNVPFESARHAMKAHFKYRGRQMHLVKPTTYMNLSGKSMNYWMKELKVPKAQTLVIVDDLALPFGKLRMRGKGSSAGHNGLKNIEMLTGGADYPRLRFGIGDQFAKGQQIDYVLSNFSQEEFDALPAPMDKAIEMVYGFATVGIAHTMSQYND